MTVLSTRQTWIDAAKGIGIVLVVYGHVQRGLVNAGVMAGDVAAAWVDYTLYVFHMPLFFFLAGLVVQKSLQKGTRGFMRGKVQTIVYPYVLWSVVQGVLQWLASGDVSDLPTLGKLGGVTEPPVGQFWFLYALMLCHIVYALISKQKPWVIVVLGFVMLALAPYAPERMASLLRHFVFYAGGMMVVPALVQARGAAWHGVVVAALFALAVVGAGHYAGVVPVNGALAISGFVPLPAAVLGIAMVVAAAKTLRGALARALVFLGQMSMSIFVMHIIVLAAVRAVLLKLGVDDGALHIVVGLAAGIMLPVTAHLILQRLNLLHWAGLGQRFAGKSTL